MINVLMAKARLAGGTYPIGKYNDHGIWHPSPFEHCECCDRIQTPSRNRPLTLLKHCRTLRHVKNLVEKYKAPQKEV